MKRIAMCAALVCSLFASAYAADVKLDGVKCIMNPKADAKADKSVEYKGGKVYFCCDNCPKAFEKDKEKHAAKANHQLVATAQAKQAKCPLSGGELNKDTEITINGAKVQFCCNMCKGKVEKASDTEKLDLVFSDKAFEKAEFKVEKEKK